MCSDTQTCLLHRQWHKQNGLHFLISKQKTRRAQVKILCDVRAGLYVQLHLHSVYYTVRRHFYLWTCIYCFLLHVCRPPQIVCYLLNIVDPIHWIIYSLPSWWKFCNKKERTVRQHTGKACRDLLPLHCVSLPVSLQGQTNSQLHRLSGCPHLCPLTQLTFPHIR